MGQIIIIWSSFRESFGPIHFLFAGLLNTRVYFQSGPSASVNYLVDDTSVTQQVGGGHVSTAHLNHVIDQQRKSDIHVQ